jgi:hypothetical protein
MQNPQELRQNAQHCRQLASTMTDQRTIDALNELADEYDDVADHLEKTPASDSPGGK